MYDKEDFKFQDVTDYGSEPYNLFSPTIIQRNLVDSNSIENGRPKILDPWILTLEKSWKWVD